MSYKIGDKVKIVNREKLERIADVVASMCEYNNKIATIKNIGRYTNDKGFEEVLYKIDLDGGKWQWYEECFTPAKLRGFEVVSDEFRKHPNVDIQIPQRNDKGSCGYDLRIPCEVKIAPHSHSDLIFTDICSYMQEDEVLKLFVRSSIGCKKGLILANGTGIIDSSYYPRNIGIKFYNTTDKEVVLEENERVCQGIFEKYLITDNDKCVKESRIGGFGSSNE